MLENHKDQVKDLDLLDPNQPLLKEFRTKAKGTYDHTRSVLTLVENVTSVTGIESEALKVAAMYHDVGKMFYPDYYTENQTGDNIHDTLDPYVSYQLITQHVANSVLILVDNNFPSDVIRIVSQHHGNSILRTIYEKAKKVHQDIAESLFRYKTTKPSSVESLILMLCDTVEATAKSLYLQQKKDTDPSQLVGHTFNRLMMDGQFENVTMRLGLLSDIQKSLVDDVSGHYHKRLKYPDDDELDKKE